MVLSYDTSHFENSPCSSVEYRTALSGCRPSQNIWVVSPHVGRRLLSTSTSPFIITQPKCWYSLYRPTEARRLILSVREMGRTDGFTAQNRVSLSCLCELSVFVLPCSCQRKVARSTSKFTLTFWQRYYLQLLSHYYNIIIIINIITLLLTNNSNCYYSCWQ